MELTSEQMRVHERLEADLMYSAELCAKIKIKEGGELQPFLFNKAQRFLHERIEDQKRRKGFVRIIIVKGRQLGGSTYVSWRFYRRSSRFKGVGTFIMSHEADTTNKLFSMVKRFHENMPPPMRSSLKNDSRKALVFDGLDSEYYVGTAGNEKAGVGGTVQQFHGSEVALWENDKEIVAGVMQSIGRKPGTEVIWESTARGLGNRFAELTMDAIKGEGDYEVVFMPWYWSDDYRAEPPVNFSRTEEEQELVDLYKLDDEQLYWRRLKILELKDVWLFKREYPMNVMEAFLTSGEGYIPPEIVLKARKRPRVRMPYCPVIVGVDPNGCGKKADRAVIAWRQGKAFLKYEKYGAMMPMELAGILARILAAGNVDAMFIDYAHGFAVYNRLVELGWGEFVFPVNFAEGATPAKIKIYANKRAEILSLAADWILEDDCSVPDDDELHTDFVIIPKPTEDSNNVKLFPAKAKIKKLYGISPDIYDAFALTFSAPVKKRNPSMDEGLQRKGFTPANKNGIGRKSSLSAVNFMRNLNSGNGSGGSTILPYNGII